MLIRFIADDGGRAAAGFRGTTGDCATRAVAIATGLPYRHICDAINAAAQSERTSKRRRRNSNARTGVHHDTMRRYMAALGWRWTPCMGIGTGCNVHLRADELPAGRIIVSLSHHYAAVIDGVLHDTYDCSRDGTRCVYGYWSVKSYKQRRNSYLHETGLAPVDPCDELQPLTRMFTGTPWIHRAYVLNRTSGKIVEACGHRHRTHDGAVRCAERMLAAYVCRSAEADQ